MLGGERGRGGFCGSWHGECNFEFAKDSIIGRFGYFQDRRPRRMNIFVEKVVLTATCYLDRGISLRHDHGGPRWMYNPGQYNAMRYYSDCP